MNIALQNTVFTATLAGGCFWCLEALFSELQGVGNVRSGFSGGNTANPDYQSVCEGNTGYAEVIHFDYNPEEISFVDIAKIFFTVHNPTTLNRQGNDVGTQYRSAIFYHDDFQKMVAEEIIRYLEDNAIWQGIVTEVVAFETFYPADDSHNNYFVNHPNNAYCHTVISPKVEKFKTLFKEQLKRH